MELYCKYELTCRANAISLPIGMEKMRDNANDETQKFAGLMFGMLLIRLFGLNHSQMEFSTFGYLSERLYQLSNVEDSFIITLSSITNHFTPGSYVTLSKMHRFAKLLGITKSIEL